MSPGFFLEPVIWFFFSITTADSPALWPKMSRTWLCRNNRDVPKWQQRAWSPNTSSSSPQTTLSSCWWLGTTARLEQREAEPKLERDAEIVIPQTQAEARDRWR